jgi:hypothetical protein
VAYAARQPAGTLEQALNALSGMYSKRFYLLEASADASAKDEDAGIIYSAGAVRSSPVRHMRTW